MKATTSERLKQIMKERNLRQADILELIQPFCKKYNVKLEKNALSQYVSGKFTPKQDKLTILALGLNVSEVWLMGFDVPMERQSHVTDKVISTVKAMSMSTAEMVANGSYSSTLLNEDENKLLTIFRTINEAGKASLLAQAEMHAKVFGNEKDK